jgi:hypothetical protein
MISSRTHVADATHSLPGPRAEEQNDEDCVDHDRRPQQYADPMAADADIGKVQRGERTVCQHPVKRLAGRAVRPAGYPETDQSDAGEAAHYVSYTDDLGA